MISTHRPAIVLAALLAGTAATAVPAAGQAYSTQKVAVAADVVATGLEHPWGLDFLPDGAALVTERPGRLRLVGADGSLSAPIAGLPQVAAGGQGGLLDVAVARDFARSGTIFFTFSEPGQGGAGTAIARARLVRDAAVPRLENVEVLFSMARKTGRGQHFGSRIALHPDGTVFFSTGDRGDGKRAQDMSDAAGAILRINPDGSIPADNPYAAGAGGALPQIWSKGHRNPQGIALDADGALWTVEHGAQGGDEVNSPMPGLNYGWPQITYGQNYGGGQIGIGTRADGFEQPRHYWDPSIAPSGLVVYDGAMFPEWRGDLIAGALKFQLVARLHFDQNGEIGGEERMFAGEFGRIRDVNQAPDGSLWLLTDEPDGKIVRLTRAD
jgi:glucose/arabinose dehydrogenase